MEVLPVNKWTDELNRQFLKEEQIANKYMKNVQIICHNGNEN
jgi:hypothetical protein